MYNSRSRFLYEFWSKSDVAIKFNYIEPFRVPDALKLKAFLNDVLHLEKKLLKTINYIFCADEYLLRINKDFLQHDYFTDIITFDLSEGEFLEAEIYISIERVRENADIYGISFKRELCRVMIHGVLHLSGYKDKTKSEIARMRSKEEQYLLLFEKKFDVSL
jgi:rRNA maturation RNase YbeY